MNRLFKIILFYMLLALTGLAVANAFPPIPPYTLDTDTSPQLGGDLDLNEYDIIYNDLSTYGNLFSAFTSGTSQYADITISQNNLWLASFRFYVASMTSGTTDYTNWETIFYHTNNYHASQRIRRPFNFTLFASYVQNGIAVSGVTIPLVNITGLTDGDLIVICEPNSGTTEYRVISGSPFTYGSRSGVTVSIPLTYAHSTNRVVSQVYESNYPIFYTDDDVSEQLHLSLRPLATPNTGCNIVPYFEGKIE